MDNTEARDVVRRYRPLSERAESIQTSAREILEVLAASQERLTARQLWRRTGHLEMKARKFLALLRHYELVDVVRGGAGEHGCKYRACRCDGYAITEAGRACLTPEPQDEGGSRTTAWNPSG